MTDPTEAIRADNSCDICHGTGHYYLYGNEGPRPCPCKTKPEVKADPLREALEPFVTAAKVIAARPQDYDDNRIVSIGGLVDACDLTKLHFERLLTAIVAPQPPASITTEQEFIDMLWKWFEDRDCDLGPERRHGLTAENFRTMLDDHESSLLQAGGDHPPVTTDRAAVIEEDRCPVHGDNPDTDKCFDCFCIAQERRALVDAKEEGKT